jgi:hypothetical protein
MKFLVMGLLSISTLVDCGKESRGGNISVNSDGSCSHQYINDNNEIVDAGQAEDITRAKIACDAFRSRHARAASCNGASVKNPTQMRVFEASSIYDLCDVVDQALLPEKNTPTAPPHDSLTLIGQGIINTDVTKLKFTILDPDKLASVKGANGKFLENGFVVNAAPLGKSDAFCKVDSESASFKKDSVYRGKIMTDGTLPNINHVKIVAADPQGESISFLCATSSSLKISFKDIKEALKGIVDVSDEP